MVWKYIGQRYINDENTVDYYLKTDRYPSYNTLGARIWRTFLKHYTFAFNIDNIFDVRYIDDRLRESPGRQMNLEFNITF
jgi:outer membrane receptor protein involved in Fe transport